MKILAIGNSFSANATQFLKEIVKNRKGHRLVFGHACIGGCPLEKHYRLAMKHERNPRNSEGRPYWHKGRKRSLRQMLLAEKWQYVTIQQYSMHSFRIGTYRPWAAKLCRYIRKYAPQAKIIFHQTWAYRQDDKSIFRRGFTPKRMHDGLVKAYGRIAEEVGIGRIIPVGEAFRLATMSRAWRFKRDPKFNYRHPVYPKQPRETHSLHAGFFWREKDGQKEFRFDSHHANDAGKYLGGCVWFEFFFGVDARKIRFRPRQISARDAKFLKSSAHAAVAAQR